MKILALEFSSDERSVAIADGGNAGMPRVLAAAGEHGGRSSRAIALIERCLSQANVGRKEIDLIAIGLGPGSYTGIRASLALAQGWQLGRGIKTIGISTVQCLALQAQTGKFFGRVNLAIDAQRNEYYLATYEVSENSIAEVEPLHLTSAAEVQSRISGGQRVLGPDAQRLGGESLFPNASTLACLAAARQDFAPAEKLEPIYLREVAFVKAPPPRHID